MAERSLIEFFRKHAPTHDWITVGPGQDCASLEWPSSHPVAFKIDQTVEGIHFSLDGNSSVTPFEIGWKAVAKTTSDIAAAGCLPIACMVSLAAPSHLDEQFHKQLFEGISACCKKFNFALAGGDLSGSKHSIHISTAMIGSTPEKDQKIWTRAGAQPGDSVFVTGTLGGSQSRKHLNFTPRINEALCIRQILGEKVNACIDITDGLGRDAGHICKESSCGIHLEESKIPFSQEALSQPEKSLEKALGDGEDFELLFCISPDAEETLQTNWKHSTPIQKIGVIPEKGQERRLKLISGKTIDLPDVGFEHLAEE